MAGGMTTSCSHCDGNGWKTTDRVAELRSGGFCSDVYMLETIRCPARCDNGVLVLARDVGARALPSSNRQRRWV